jgi:hypothetical protein
MDAEGPSGDGVDGRGPIGEGVRLMREAGDGTVGRGLIWMEGGRV